MGGEGPQPAKPKRIPVVKLPKVTGWIGTGILLRVLLSGGIWTVPVTPKSERGRCLQILGIGGAVIQFHLGSVP